MTGEIRSDLGVPQEATTSGQGAAWGLASLWLGSTVLLAAPLMVVYLLLAWQFGPKRPLRLENPDELAFSVVTVLGTMGMLGLAGCGLWFGLKGRRIDRDNRRESPLPSAGILMGAAAGIAWIIVGINVLFILNTRQG
jgi:hypothetical protein